MSDVKKLLAGIVIVMIGLSLFLSGSGILPAAGVVVGLIGLAVIVYVLVTGKL